MGLNFLYHFADDMAVREASDQARERARVDLVDLGLPDLDQKHMRNSRQSISLVRSNS